MAGSAATSTRAAAPAPVGLLLRQWRERRRFSQLELSGRADVSTRHLSCVENGRSRPTPELILRLADHLEVPLGQRDRLLLAAGFAPQHGGRGLEDDELGVVMAGLRDLLDAHLPYPALLLDEHWDVVDSNEAVDLLLAGCAPELLQPPLNALRVSLHPRGLAPRIRNRDVWSRHLLRQVAHRHERTDDPVLAELMAELASYVEDRAPAPHTGPPGSPVLALELESAGGVLRFFSVASQLEVPTDAVLEGLHLETFLPADALTRAAFGDARTSPYG